MTELYSKRIKNVPKSFVREILKVTEDSSIISFAGGLPNPKFFPSEEIEKATALALNEDKEHTLQYSTTEGYKPLREFIANRYKKKGMDISADEILIVSGSQQAMDLVGKVFIDEGDGIILEKPAYLGAIQSFSMYQPKFTAVDMEDDGISIEGLKEALKDNNNRMIYTVTNFQNPSGITYSKEKREAMAAVINDSNVIYIEDDPYGELRFIGEEQKPVSSLIKKNRLLFGSFSKIVAPAMRLGWVAGDKEIIEKLTIAKQAADLQTNSFSQRVVYKYLENNDLDEHIALIRKHYRAQRNAMVEAMRKYFPKDVSFTETEGGMFIWVTLPNEFYTEDLIDEALKNKVAFVPGSCFYVDSDKSNTMRLNYTNCDEETIERGIKILGELINKFLNR